MRHSSIDLTMNVYTDTKLLDVHGVLESLPTLDFGDEQKYAQLMLLGAGTKDYVNFALHQWLHQRRTNRVKRSRFLSK